MLRRAALVVGVSVVVSGSVAAQSAGEGVPDANDRLLNNMSMDIALRAPEQYILERKQTVETLRPHGPSRKLVIALLDLSDTYRRFGLTWQEMKVAAQSLRYAPDEKTRAIARTATTLALGRGTLLAGKLAWAWGQLQLAEGFRRPIPPGDRREFDIDALTLRFDILLYLGDHLVHVDAKSAADLKPSDQLLLRAVFRDSWIGPADAAPPVTNDDLKYLDDHRPWRDKVMGLAHDALKALLDKAKDTKGMVQARTAEYFRAKASQLAERNLDYDNAIPWKKQSLLMLERYQREADALNVLQSLAHLEDELKSSQRLVDRVEHYATAMGGQTLQQFMGNYQEGYQRYYDQLQSDFEARKASPQSGMALGEVMLQLDRMNLRAVRQDQLLYRRYGDPKAYTPDPQLLSNLRTAERELSKARIRRDAARAAGKSTDDFPSLADILGQGPFFDYEAAKQDLVSALEDVKRKRLDGSLISRLPSLDWGSVLDGMSHGQAIVMYGEEPESGLLRAVVIRWIQNRGRAQMQPVDLGKHDSAELTRLISSLRNAMAVRPDAVPEGRSVYTGELAATLDRLSSILWQPLPDLPPRVTVLLTPHLLGIPFEALTDKAGHRVMDAHAIRYAFGLQSGVARYVPVGPVRRALVLGADRFSDPGMALLAPSREEVAGIRQTLAAHGATIAPDQPMSKMGAELVASAEPYDVVHVSTHSRLDQTTPMIDALLFPGGDVFGYQLAMSPVRASLAVLSACELFTPRGNAFYPVSGISTAFLANIAPQVVTTLWDVNAETTSLFMRRFYEALADQPEASEALAMTKRTFNDASALDSWMRSAGMTAMTREQLSALTHPANWAPFVLVVAPI